MAISVGHRLHKICCTVLLGVNDCSLVQRFIQSRDNLNME